MDGFKGNLVVQNVIPVHNKLVNLKKNIVETMNNQKLIAIQVKPFYTTWGQWEEGGDESIASQLVLLEPKSTI